ncbi:MAG: hypothetical protein HYS87_00765 [Candidatus Colwellbacteria bacterium]|nr:hypothetical protein [Candidatus Colwellbacteria bacterium]
MPRWHATGDIQERDVLDMFGVAGALREKLNITGGGLCMRFGDPRLSGATIMHPHVHLIVPRIPGEDEKPTLLVDVDGSRRKFYPAAVYFPIG